MSSEVTSTMSPPFSAVTMPSSAALSPSSSAALLSSTADVISSSAASEFSTADVISSSATIYLPPPSSAFLPPPSSVFLPPPSSAFLPPPSSVFLPPPSSASLPPPSSASLPPPSSAFLPPPSSAFLPPPSSGPVSTFAPVYSSVPLGGVVSSTPFTAPFMVSSPESNGPHSSLSFSVPSTTPVIFLTLTATANPPPAAANSSTAGASPFSSSAALYYSSAGVTSSSAASVAASSAPNEIPALFQSLLLPTPTRQPRGFSRFSRRASEVQSLLPVTNPQQLAEISERIREKKKKFDEYEEVGLKAKAVYEYYKLARLELPPFRFCAGSYIGLTGPQLDDLFQLVMYHVHEGTRPRPSLPALVGFTGSVPPNRVPEVDEVYRHFLRSNQWNKFTGLLSGGAPYAIGSWLVSTVLPKLMPKFVPVHIMPHDYSPA